jgi:uncharacterized membrane protein
VGGEQEQAMNRTTLFVLGAVLIVLGAVWTLQGLGYLPGSVMSGVTFWAVVGPIVALVGVVLVVRGATQARR